jgi:hypothetical protein
MITKRQLGIFFTFMGLLLTLGIFSVEWLEAGNFQGIGPLQRIALIGSVGITLLGLSLIPFGDRPA